jgi:cellulase/cellobiase CelA1
MAWLPYTLATGTQKRLLGRIALTPKAKWFGNWIPNSEIAGKVRSYIDNATGGDPDVMVHMTLFRMNPWEQDACTMLPTSEQKASYKQYVRRFARAVGETHAAIVLQPDGPFALCAPGGSRAHSRLIAYSAERLSRLPNATTYIEAGTAEWNGYDPQRAVRLLVRGGVEHVRGFTFNVTHYESTASQVRFGAQVVEALADRGIPGKHFVVDTAENGRPFTGKWWRAHNTGERWDNATTCQKRSDRRCVTLGIPPTTRVAAKRWGLPPDVRRLARRHVDAYLWAGRPWLLNQTAPFDLSRGLAVARTTPWRKYLP